MADLQKLSKQNLIYRASPQLAAFPSLRHAFFTREGGVSGGEYASLNFRMNSTDERENVLKNYEIAAAHLGALLENVSTTVQMHTDNIIIVNEPFGLNAGSAREPVDALITDARGICLTGFYADCQLIMIYEHRRKVCAVAHCGWRGIAGELTRKTIEKMTNEFGCRPADMTVAVGPSICRRCFETGEDVPEAMFSAYGEMIREYIYMERGKWHVDLKNITYATLLRYGVQPYNIDISSECTCCGPQELFWSHRRHGEARGAHAGMIMLV